MALTIRVYSDYVCPYCFLAEGPLQEATKGQDVEIEWMPFELRPEPNETLRPEDDYLQNAWRSSILPMAARFGVKMELPSVSPQPHTHLAFEGYQFAKEHGKGSEYNHRMFRAFFQESQDIGSIDVLTKLAGEIGLDQEKYREALVNRTYRDAHRRALYHAYNEAEVDVVPTFFIGDRKLKGLFLADDLRRVIAEEAAKQTGSEQHGLACSADGEGGC